MISSPRPTMPAVHFHCGRLSGVNLSLDQAGSLEVQVLDFQIEQRFLVDIGGEAAALLFARVAAVVAPIVADAPVVRVHQQSQAGELDGARLCLVDADHRLCAVVAAGEDPGQASLREVAAALLHTAQRAIAGRAPLRHGGPAMGFPVDRL